MEIEQRELQLYIENTAELYPMVQAIVKNLTKKYRKGTYNKDLAKKAWYNLTVKGAKAYAKEFAKPYEWIMFTPEDRIIVASNLEEIYYDEIILQQDKL